MTTNQTIDGVSRELLEAAVKADASRGATASELVAGWAAMDRLRALLDAPAIEQEPYAYAHEWATWISTEGPRDFKAVIDREAPPQWAVDSGQARNIIPLYDRPAAQPQGEPVAWMYRRKGGECLGQLVQMESDSLKNMREGKVVEGRRILWARDDYIDWKPLYAEQHAPVAVVLPERRSIDESASDADQHSDYGWNACLDEVTRLNTK